MNPKENPQRILITGGAGYIGSHITDLLKESAWQIIILGSQNNRRALA